MAEELEIGRLVASFTLDHSELKENAKEAEEILDDLEKKAQNTKPKVTADTGEVTEKTKEAEKAIEDVGEKAKNIKPKIDIDMDVDKVVKKAEEAENAIDEVENKAKETKPELPEPKTEKYETALEKLTKLISEQKITLNNLKKEYQNAALEQGKDSQKVQELDEAIRELNEELQKNIKTFNDAQYSDNEYNEEIENTEKTAEEAEEAIDDLNESTEQLSGGFTVAKGAAADLVSKGLQVVASKTIEIGKDIINTGEQFTAAMSEVAAISGATGAELEKLEQTARQYGATTEFSAIEAAQALKYMALAGWDVETSIAALPGVLDLAAASGMDLAQASDMVTDYLSAFNMEAEQSAYFADLLTYAQGHSNTSTEQLGQAYINCAANLNAAGQDVETTTSFLEAMANQGLKSAEAGTAMAAIMRDLTDKMENGAVKIGDTSVKVKDAEGNFRDLTDIMKDVEKAVDGLGSADKTAALSATFTQEAINGVNLVLNEGVENISGYEEALRNSGGAAADAAKEMNDNLSGDIKNMNSAFEELKLKIYDDAESPLRDLVQLVTEKGVPALEALTNNVDKLVPVVVAAGTAFAGYKAAIGVQSIVKGVAQATTALTAAKTAEKVATDEATVSQGALNTVQAANPIGLLVAAIGLLVGGLTSYALIAGSAEESTDNLSGAVKTAKESVKECEAAIKECSDAMDTAKDKYNDAVASAEAQAAEIKVLAENYETLRTKQNLTSGEMALLDTVAQELAQSMGKNLEDLKDENGEYKDLKTNVEEYCKKLKIQAELEAKKELYSDAVKARSKAEMELAKYQQENYELTKKRADIEATRDAKAHGATGITWDMEQEINALNDYDAKVKEFQETIDDAAATEQLYADSIDKTIEKQGKAEDATTSSGNSIAEQGGNIDDVNQKLNEMKTGIEGVESADDSLEDKLTEVNKDLEENKGKLRTARTELKDLEKDINNFNPAENSLDDLLELQKRYDELINTIGGLETEQTKYRNKISELKKDMEKAAEAAKTLDEKLADLSKTGQTVRSEMDSLASSYNQLDNGQSLSLSSLLSLCDKYPEYTGMLLEAAGNADKQKEAIETLFEAKKQEYLLTLQKAKDEIQASNDVTETEINNIKKQIQSVIELALAGETLGENQLYALKKSEEQLADLRAELDKGKLSAENYQTAIDKIANINIDNYNPPNNNNNNNSGGSSGNSGTSGNSKKATTWTTSGSGETATGATRVESQLNWLDRMSNLGKMTEKQQKAYLEKMLKNEKMTADERYQVRLKLKNLTDKLNDKDKQKADEKKKEEEQRNNDRYNNYLKTIDNKKALDQLSLKSEIASYDYMLKYFKMTEDQKLEITKRRYNAQKQLREQEEKEAEEKRKAEIESLNKLGDAVVAALKNKYQQQKELEEKRINESIKSWEKWEEETCDSIQGQIDALDELKNTHDEENKREEYENKRQALELKARYEKDDYNRQQIEKEIAALDKEENERLFNLGIEEQKKALQAQAEDVRKIAQQNIEKLEEQSQTISDTYGQLMTDQALQGAAKEKILNSTQKEITDFINQYASDFEMLGTTLGESLYSGMKKKVGNITGYVDKIAASTDTQAEKTQAAKKLETYVSGSSKRLSQVTSAGSSLSNFAAKLDSVSAIAAQYKQQLAATANAAADKYYQTKNYQTQNTATSVTKPVTVNMTVNFNDKVDSPIEVKRQMEYVSQQLAKEISNA